jgi:hypothetical protein
MANGRAGYFLQRDVGESGTGLQDLWEGSVDQQAGINKYRGIGRGLGTLAGILLAGSGAGIPLLALAGGLGSLTGSVAGGALGKHKYGAPAKAEKGGLFHRDIAKEQRKSVDDYWKGMKEQVGVNVLQDAITAGMYGGKIQNIAGMNKPMAAPMTPNVPISAAQPEMLGDEALSQLTSNWSTDALQMADPASKIAGGVDPNLLTTGAAGGTGAGINTPANIATGIDPFSIESTAVESLEQRLGGGLGAASPAPSYTGTYDQNISLFKDYPQLKGKSFEERKRFWESLNPNSMDLNANYGQAMNRASAMQAGGLKVPETLNQFQFAGQQGSYLSDAINRSGIDSSILSPQAQNAYWGDINEGAPWRTWE